MRARACWSAPVRVTDGSPDWRWRPHFCLSLFLCRSVCAMWTPVLPSLLSKVQTNKGSKVDPVASVFGEDVSWSRWCTSLEAHAICLPGSGFLFLSYLFFFGFLFFLFWFLQSINNSWMKLRSRGGCGLTMALLTPTNPCTRLLFFFFSFFPLPLFPPHNCRFLYFILFYFLYWVRVFILTNYVVCCDDVDIEREQGQAGCGVQRTI